MHCIPKPETPARLLRAGLLACALAILAGGPARAAVGEPEKDALRFGFIKLTDMAPLAVAYEQGFFEDEGLYVRLEAQANWKVLLDGVIDGRLDGAQMLPGQALAATIGYGTRAHIVTPISLDLNGNAITVSNEVWAAMRPHLPRRADGRPRHPIGAQHLKPVVARYRAAGRPFRMGMVFPVSTHNYELRYWLAAGGLHPGYYAPHKGDTAGTLEAEVLLSVTPPPQMPATMEAGTLQGYCVGEPWNQQAVLRGIGVALITDHEIWRYNPEKVFGMTRAFTERYPNTTVRIVKALLRAARWLDAAAGRHRKAAAKMLSHSYYVGADEAVIAGPLMGRFEYAPGDRRPAPDFNVFFRHHATYPYYSDAVWTLTQMRRWGQIPDYRPDAWYLEVARKVYRPDIYRRAAEALIAEGRMRPADFPDFRRETGFRPPQDGFIDGIVFDATRPNAYLEQFPIGLKGRDRI